MATGTTKNPRTTASSMPMLDLTSEEGLRDALAQLPTLVGEEYALIQQWQTLYDKGVIENKGQLPEVAKAMARQGIREQSPELVERMMAVQTTITTCRIGAELMEAYYHSFGGQDGT